MHKIMAKRSNQEMLPCVFQAISAEIKANGSAKTVCWILIRSANWGINWSNFGVGIGRYRFPSFWTNLVICPFFMGFMLAWMDILPENINSAFKKEISWNHLPYGSQEAIPVFCWILNTCECKDAALVENRTTNACRVGFFPLFFFKAVY